MTIPPQNIQLIGAGPAPMDAVMSDRAGDVAGVGDTAEAFAGPFARAIAMLDSSAQQMPHEESSRHSRPSRREEILDAAEGLFRENGYQGSSLRDISREAGISHPGMLHHFSSKDALLAGVLDRLEAHAQSLLDRIATMGVSFQALEAEFDGDWSPRHPMNQLLATLSAESVSPDHPGRFRTARVRRVHEHVFAEVMKLFAERGELRAGIDPDFAARVHISLLISLAIREVTVRPLQHTTVPSAAGDLKTQLRLFLADPAMA